MLCLHNYEDVVRMIDLLPILSYLEILNGQYRILSTRIDTYHAFNGEVGNEMIITMQNDYPVPKRVSCKSSMEEVYEMFFSRTMVVIIEAVISIIAVVVLKKAQSKK